MQQQSYTINGLSNPAIAVGSVCEFNMLDKYLRAAVRQIYPLVAGTSNEDRNLKSTGEYSLMLHAFHALGNLDELIALYPLISYVIRCCNWIINPIWSDPWG